MNTKYAVFGLLLVALLALAGCANPWQPQAQAVDKATCSSGYAVFSDNKIVCQVVDDGNAARDTLQAAGGTGAPNIQVGNVITHTSGVFGVDVDDGISFADQPNYETHPNGQMYITCADLEKVIGLKLDYANGGCHLRYQQHDVWVGYVPMPVYALGADNKTWGPCTGVEAGLHRGLSFYAAIPSLDILSVTDPRTEYLPHYDGVKLACSADEMNAVLEEAANAGRRYQSNPAGNGMQAAAPGAMNNEGAASAAPQAVPQLEGWTSHPIDGGVQYTSSSPRDFPIPDGKWAMWGTQAQKQDNGVIKGITVVSVYDDPMPK